MTFSRYTLRPSFRAALLAFLVHHNPFYLLSALFMVAGCYALNSGLAPRTGDLPAVPGYRVLREIEHPLLSVTLAATRGNQIRAADLLGLNRNTLRKKIRDLEIPVVRGLM